MKIKRLQLHIDGEFDNNLQNIVNVYIDVLCR